VRGWYKTLAPNALQPPDWVFGPVWTALYASMGFASWAAWAAGASKGVLGLYALQLAANFAWTPTFFVLKDLTLALADLALITGLAAVTAVKFGAVTPLAGWLMVPYVAWSGYATALTAKLWIDNPSARESEPRARLRRAFRRVSLRKGGGGGSGRSGRGGSAAPAPVREPSLERPGGGGAAASAAAIEAAAAAAADKAVAAAAAVDAKLA
jgi:translocator protein